VAKWKSRLKLFARRLVIALLVTALFALLAIFPSLGYFAKASTKVVSMEGGALEGLWIVDANCDILYNPFLYPFAWLSGQGHRLTSFTFLSIPTFAGSGENSVPVWRHPAELDDDAITIRTTDELLSDIPYVFLILLAVGLVVGWDSYLYFIGGIVGFAVGGILGTVVGFFAGAFLIFYILPRLKKNEDVSKLWNSFLSKMPKIG
jgi:hypothetical protein